MKIGASPARIAPLHAAVLAALFEAANKPSEIRHDY